MKNAIQVTKPGEQLLQELDRRGMRQKELALRTGVTEKHISTIINENKPISISFGRKLDIALGDEIGTWSGVQTAYDNFMADLDEILGITSEERDAFKRMSEVVSYFIKHHLMYDNCETAEKIMQLRQVLCVNKLTVIPEITYNAAYRAQINKDTRVDPYVLFAWQRMCELQTEDMQIDVPFDADRLAACIPDIKQQMFEPDPMKMVAALKNLFAQCGIAFDVVHHFRRAPVQGFIKQTKPNKVILCVTIRGKGADRFWFSLFHEIGHLLNGDLTTRFVDFESVKAEIEDKADSYARNTLLDPSLYRAFIAEGNYTALKEIKKFARTVGVPHWVVVGRLHKDEYLDWSLLAHETPNFEWAS